MARIARLWRIGLAVCIPLLVAAACNEANLTMPYRGFLEAPVGRQTTAIIRVVNVGGADAKLGEVSAAALGLAAPFSLAGGTCVSGGVVPKSYGECTLEIGFTAPEAKQYTDTFQISYNWADGSKTLQISNTVTGTATAPIQVSGPAESFLDRPLDSVTEAALTVRNAGGYPVTLGDVSTGHLSLAPPFYAAGGTCLSGAALAPGGSCTINVRFAPTSIGDFEDAIEFDYNWPGSGVGSYRHTRSLEGSSLPPVSLAASPAAIAPTRLGETALQSITITNAGGQQAILGTIDDAGLGIAPPFSYRGGSCTSGLALAPRGGTCRLDIAFSPTVTGSASDVLEVRYGWSGVAAAITVRYPLFSSGVGATSGDCFQTGCSAGQACLVLTSSTANSGTCVSIPEPPAGCMAPCIWEARRKCLPVLGACLAESSVDPGDIASSTRTVCDPNTGWAVRDERVFGNIALDSYYRQNGATCYSTRVDPSSGPQVRHADSNGPIAVSAFSFNDYSKRSVWCGAYTSSQGLDPANSYTEYLSNPECQAWERTYLHATTCRSETPGSCQGF